MRAQIFQSALCCLNSAAPEVTDRTPIELNGIRVKTMIGKPHPETVALKENSFGTSYSK